MSKQQYTHDLRPFANTILSAIDEKLTTLSPGTPLFILLGEYHISPAHILLKKLLVSRLLDRTISDASFKFAYGAEIASSYFEELLTRHKIPQEISKQIRQLDTDGERSLKAHLASSVYFDANESSRSLDLFLYFNKISYSNNDLDEPRINKSVTGIAQDPPPSFESRINPAKIHLRNKAIVENALAHCERSNAKIYVQSCGSAHIFGMARQETVFPYEESLSYLFEKQGAQILPISLSIEEDNIPENARQAFENSLHLGLDSELVFKSPNDAILGENQHEKHLIGQIDEASGYEINPWNSQRYKHLLRRELKKDLPFWLEQAQSFNP